MMLAVSDQVWIAVVGGAVTLVGTWMSLKLRSIAKTGEAVHTLVNSNMGAVLKLNAVTTRKLASLDPTYEQAAELAERLDREHESKQATVDGKL